MVGVLWMCSGCFRGFIFIFVVNSANFYKNLEPKSPLTSPRSSQITSKNIRCYFIMGAMYKGMNNDEKRWIVPCRYWFHLSDKHIVYLSFFKRTNFWNASEGWHTNCNMLTLLFNNVKVNFKHVCYVNTLMITNQTAIWIYLAKHKTKKISIYKTVLTCSWDKQYTIRNSSYQRVGQRNSR